MPDQQVRHPGDPKAVAMTRNLIQYLRRYVRHTRTTVRDCGTYEDVLWLADLPTGVLDADAGRGQVLLDIAYRPFRPAPPLPPELDGWVSPDRASEASETDPPLAATGPACGDHRDAEAGAVQEVRREDAHDALDAYTRWLPRWRRWSAAERAAEPYRRLHRRLHRIADRLREDGDAFEAVLATGLIAISAERPSERVHRHVLTVPVEVSVARDTVRITVSVSGNRPVRLEDGDFLEEAHGYRPGLLAQLRRQVEDESVLPLSAAGREVLQSFADRAFGADARVHFDPGWDAPPRADRFEPVSHLALAPALVLRERGRGSVLAFYDRIAERLAGPDARSPLGLAQCLFALDADERVAWNSAGGGRAAPALGPDPLFPLAANEAQRDVLRRLQRDTGVVVQGPPGTGKTHTIANLVCALLADGKRVLVTSQKAQALRVLRDQIPADLRALCVLQGDRRYDGTDELERSIRALSHLSVTDSPDAVAERVKLADERRLRLAAERQRLRDRLRMVREAEWYEHGDVAPGYRGTLTDIIEAVRENEARHDWLPSLPPDAPRTPPLNGAETRRLSALVAHHGPALLARRPVRCPDPAELPGPQIFAAAVDALAAAHREIAATGDDPLAAALADRGDALIDALAGQIETAERALDRAGLQADPAAWRPDAWSTSALHDGMAGLRCSLWEAVAAESEQFQEMQDALRRAPRVPVELPGLTPEEETRLRAAAHEPGGLVPEGGWLRRQLVTVRRRDLRALLDLCLVDGRPPRTAADAAALAAHLDVRARVRQTEAAWRRVGAPELSAATDVAVAELSDRARHLHAVTAFTRLAREVHDLLFDAGLRVPVRAPEDWTRIRSAVARARLLRVFADARHRLDGLVAALPRPGRGDPPEAVDAYRAATAHDPRAYERALEGLARARGREADRREAHDLLDRLAAGHPELARAFRAAPADPSWRARFATFGDAWAWRRARDFQDRVLEPGREEQLDRELTEIDGQLARTVEQLAADRALGHCLARMTGAQKQALQSYAGSVAHAGKGSGAHSKRHLLGARSALATAQGAVPAWVMPIGQVAEMIEPEPDAFDVVIVDEASQVGLDGLLLLWLAPRIIVVGDDRQCAPFYIGGKHEPLHQELDTLLPDLHAWQREGLGPKSNLYALLSARFSEVIRLTEHFRCMPEIIRWSSKQFYGDNELIPLRQYGVDRLDPLRVVRVADGHCSGVREKLRNEPEARRLVAVLRELTDDPAYQDRSFGVISLRSGAQVRLLEDLIDQEIDPPVRAKHRIRVGTAEQFQGDERDVVLLSMVIDGDNTRCLNSQHDQRRFNVAASRARDQMWLFTSVTADQLKADDPRRSLLTYMQNPPAFQMTPPALEDVPADELRAPFDSLFEQRVFRRIRERGYHVVPQWKVGAKRIDLVVVGEGGRLAVECDGSPYHSTPDQIRADCERERELRRAGWRFFRIRSSAFALAPDDALAPLWRRLDALGIHPMPEPAAEPDGAWTPVPLPEQESDNEIPF